MFQMNAVTEKNIEHRPWLAVVLKRRFGGIELDHSFRSAVLVNDADRSHLN